MLWIAWEGEGVMRSWDVQQADPSPKQKDFLQWWYLFLRFEEMESTTAFGI